jgi:ferredoxin
VKKISFPKISRSISKEVEHVKVQFLTESLELILDRTKCIGCGTCARVCPKDAISRGPVGSSRRFPKLEDIIPEVYDQEYLRSRIYLRRSKKSKKSHLRSRIK